jgi:hypothetical protein
LQKVVTFFTIISQVAGKMSKCMHLFSTVSSLGTHLAHILWNWRLSCTTE